MLRRLRTARDDGFTVAELIMVVGLLGIVLAMVYANMDVFLRISGRTDNRSIAVADTRTALERVTRQIRAANPIDPLADPTVYGRTIAFSVYCSTPGVQGCGADNLRQVVYELDGNELVETVGTSTSTILGPDGPAGIPAGQRRGAVVNTAAQPVFRYYDSEGAPLDPVTDLATTFRDCTRSVEIHLVVVSEPQSSDRVDLSTRVDLRNFNEVAGC